MGVSKSVALEFPELRVRRVIVRDGAAATGATAGATAGAATDATLRRVHRAARCLGLARRSEGADPVNSNSQANAGRFDYNMYNLGLNFI